MKNPFKAIRDLQAAAKRLEERVFDLENGQPIGYAAPEASAVESLPPQQTVRLVLNELEKGADPAPSHVRKALRIAGAGNPLHLPDRGTSIALLTRYLEDHGQQRPAQAPGKTAQS